MTGVITDLYRAWNVTGRLDYIGITGNLRARLEQHCGSAWSRDVISLDVTGYPDSHQAEAAERQAIEAEHPAWDLVYSPCFESGYRCHQAPACDPGWDRRRGGLHFFIGEIDKADRARELARDAAAWAAVRAAVIADPEAVLASALAYAARAEADGGA